MAFNQVQHLTKLVRLGLATLRLQVDSLADRWLPANVVAAPNTIQLETERLQTSSNHS